jgi:hypothetical protein
LIYANVAPRFEKAAAPHQSNQVLALTTASFTVQVGSQRRAVNFGFRRTKKRVLDVSCPSIVHLGAAPDLPSPRDAAALKAKLPDALIMRSVPVVDEGSIAIACGYDGPDARFTPVDLV